MRKMRSPKNILAFFATYCLPSTDMIGAFRCSAVANKHISAAPLSCPDSLGRQFRPRAARWLHPSETSFGIFSKKKELRNYDVCCCCCQPDRPFYNSKATKSGNQRTLCSREMPIDRFQIVKRSVRRREHHTEPQNTIWERCCLCMKKKKTTSLGFNKFFSSSSAR